MRADRHVERRVGRGVEPAQATSADALDRLAAACSDVPGWRRRAPGRRRRERQLDEAAHAARGELDRARLRLRHPRLALVRHRRRHRLEVEQHGREVDAGDAVDERVMGLGDQREAPVLEPLHEPQLPQRLRAVEPLGVDPGGERAQLLLAAGLRQRGVAQVVLEVEVRVVDPQRPAGLERRERELLAVARDQVQAAADVVGEVVERGGGPSKTMTAPMCMWVCCPLLGQEGGVHRGEPIAVSLGHAPGEPSVSVSSTATARPPATDASSTTVSTAS